MNSPTLMVADKAAQGQRPNGADTGHQSADDCVGEAAHVLTDEQREAAIQRAGEAMEASYRKFRQTWHLDDLNRAYRHMVQMYELVQGRSPAQIKRMEQERGIE